MDSSLIALLLGILILLSSMVSVELGRRGPGESLQVQEARGRNLARRVNQGRSRRWER